MSRKNVLTSILLLLVTMAVCVLAIGRESNSHHVHANSSTHGTDVAGQWMLIGHSSEYPAAYIVFEVNLSPQVDNPALPGSQSTKFLQAVEDLTNQKLIDISGLQSSCGEDDELAAKRVRLNFSSATEASFTTATDGRSQPTDMTGHLTFDATGNTATGDYAFLDCQLGDSGLLMGRKISRFSGQYSGTISGKAMTVAIHEAEDYKVKIEGADGSGTAISLSGSAVGGAFSVAGADSSRSVELFGVYDPIGNDFLLYDSDFDEVGQLHSGGDPTIDAKPGLFASRQTSWP